jgi:acetyl-CoA carboxylase biotin carboxyl carrier protein
MELEMDVNKLKAIVELLAETDITRLEWQNGDERLVLRRGSVAVITPTPTLSVVPEQAVAAPVAPPPEEHRKLAVITSPLVGTFFRSPSPDDPAFVEVGQMVQPGQVLCIVEAMKLMNQIKSEVAGRLMEILVKNGQAVEFDQPLFRVDPAG